MYKDNCFEIKSFYGNYKVEFIDNPFFVLETLAQKNIFFIIDENVFKIYSKEFKFFQNSENYLLINPTEEAKSLDKFPKYIEECISKNLKRGQTVIAIGGGIIQDICGFLCSILFRGLDWIFFPTTLLAQADSCIGSKTSINVNNVKNLVGNFYPPKHIYISHIFLNTLEEIEINSGIGEIIKVHAIFGQEEFNLLKHDYYSLARNSEILTKYIRKSLLLKKKIIEEDEFDKSSRLVLNYGHSFGHAIESATNYKVPHGVAVAIGCHLANYISKCLDFNDGKVFLNMSGILRQNFKNACLINFDLDKFFVSLKKDKKNSMDFLNLILPNELGFPSVTKVENSAFFKNACLAFFTNELGFNFK